MAYSLFCGEVDVRTSLLFKGDAVPSLINEDIRRKKKLSDGEVIFIVTLLRDAESLTNLRRSIYLYTFVGTVSPLKSENDLEKANFLPI